MLKNAICLLLLISSSAAYAAPLYMIPVGDFGGIRLKAPCQFGKDEFKCTIDTMGEVSVVASSGSFEEYPVVGRDTSSGIGPDLSCDVIAVENMSLLGMEIPTFRPMRCAVENSAWPLIGISVFADQIIRFNFPRATFSQESGLGRAEPLLRFGSEKLWMGGQAEIGGQRVIAAFDTGNPVTLVSKNFVNANPRLFRKSEKPISPSLADDGLVPYEILAPINVGGALLSESFIYASPEVPDVFIDGISVILGMNHLAKADWIFDLHANKYRVSIP